MRAIVKSYWLYDRIPPSLYRIILVETDGERYQLRVSEGKVSSQTSPYAHKQTGSEPKWFDTDTEAVNAAEEIFRELESKGWLLFQPEPNS